MIYQPKFIAFEGAEGTGKSTMAKLLAKLMSEQGLGSWLTEEPGKEEEGIRADLRKLIFNKELHKANPKANLLLFLADRLFHEKQIKFILDAGSSVITDRYEASTWAYQLADGVFNHHQMQQMMGLCFVRKPDIYIWMKGDTAKCLERAKISDGHHGQYEDAELDFHTRMAEHYEEFFTGWGIVNRVITVENTHVKPVKEALKEVLDGLAKCGVDVRETWPLNP